MVMARYTYGLSHYDLIQLWPDIAWPVKGPLGLSVLIIPYSYGLYSYWPL